MVNEQTGRWQHWRERVPAWQYPAGVERPKFAQLVIPTLDSVRYEHLLGLVHSVGKATLVGGPSLGQQGDDGAQQQLAVAVASLLLETQQLRGGLRADFWSGEQ